MWSRFFGKKDILTIEVLTNQFESILKKSNSYFISLVGVQGKIKGLDIITVRDDYCEFDKNEIKKFIVKLTEFYLRFKSLDFFQDNSKKTMRFINFNYGDLQQFAIIPIPDNSQFIIVCLTQSVFKIISNLEKLNKTIAQLTYKKQ